MSLKFLFASALAATAVARAAPVLPTIPSTVFKATAYGALGNGTGDDTSGIQAAIGAAQNAGGGIVELTPGTFPCGPISIGSGVDLQVDAGATLQMLPYGTYPLGGTVYTNFISVTGNNVAITGPGTIDGQGAAWWAAYNANNNIPHRPYLIKFTNCNDGLIQNVTLVNSPMFHVAFAATNNFTANNVTITASASSPNTDGIDPSGMHYLIENCNISNGDDCVCVKPQDSFCSDITVTNCTFGTGHGVSVGGQTNDGLNGLTVTNCSFNGTTNGLRLKADPTEGGPVSNLTYSNLTMVNVQYPIVFYSYYDQVGTPGATSGSNQTTVAKVKLWNSSPPDSLALPTIPTWQNITLSNITAVRGSAAQGYSTVWGLPSQPISNLTFNNVILDGYIGLELFNAQDVQCTGATNLGPLLVYNAQVLLVQPRAVTVAPGTTVAFAAQVADTTASAGAVAPSFQWTAGGKPIANGPLPDGAVVSGATSGLLMIRDPQAAEGGSYAATVNDALDGYGAAFAPGQSQASLTTAAATLNLAAAGSTGRLLNLSARGTAGATALIAGFAIGGAGNDGSSKPLLVRGVGPSLAAYQVTGFLADPALQVASFPAGTVLASNDNWGGNAAVSAAASQVGAFPLASASSLDAALVGNFGPGEYTAAVSANAGPGIALAEVYDATASFSGTTPRLINLSARSNAGTGLSVLVGGFVMGGNASRTILLRGIGPSLAAFGVAGVLSAPTLQVYDASETLVGTNTTWNGDANVAATAAAVGAFPLASAASADSAMVLTLPPGAYSAMVSGVGGVTGNAMVELYEVP